MNVKKFSASSSRDALRQVREALGPDAVILSNRNLNGMVEILALASEDMSSLAAPMVERETLPAQIALPEQESTMLSAFARRRSEADQAAGLAGALEQSRNANARVAEAAAPGKSARDSDSDGASTAMAAMMSEIRSLRTMMESQFSELSWSSQQKQEPIKGVVMREMLAAGFSPSLARHLTEKMPAGCTAAAALSWIKSVLSRNISAIGDESAMLEQGGVFALVGPTGVGKTTTTAKLAARCVMRHGAGKLALITTDGYRIGGYEQLRIYGKILGVMVHSVKDESDLRIALDELKNKHTVLIDTVGVSQRDQMVTEQVAMLQGAGSQVKRLLCLNATSTGETLNEVVRAYQGSGLAGCVMTKLDEAATIGNVLDVVIRQKLNLFYVANGQRVPEDLHVANKQYLVDRAFKLKRETTPFQFTDAELPMLMAGTTRSSNDRTLREVNLG
ncbi:flagellar biosynthesis protein FlhF [Actimicrobium antarcticum]|uniref:Flagellar biosynthesis protein FlhF n=1 Tax=Actimicrobium antarcticum TaxID=1051899 RepID=A0ABP7U2G7_9BURK